MEIIDYLLARKKAGGGSDVTIEQLNVTENGTYSEPGKAYSPVIVEVPEPTLITKSITANGTYSASDDNADGYSSVTVAVEGFKKKSIANTPTDIASFNDGTANPMPSLKISIEPQQDLHGYDNPWVGGAGKNKFDATLLTNPTANVQWLQMTLSANTQYTISSSIPYSAASAYIFCIGGTDTSSATSANSGVGLNAPRTVTSDNNGIISVGYRNVGADGTLDLANYTYQIESGQTATPFAPYSNICPISGHTEADVTVTDDLTTPTETHILSIPFHDNSDNPITVYGGTLNVTSGELTVDRAILTIDGSAGNISKPNVNRFNIDNLISNYKRSIGYSSGICSLYKSLPQEASNGNFDTAATNYNTCYDLSSQLQTIRIKDTRYDDINDFSAMLAIEKPTIVYELATPITYHLTPTQIRTLVGNNNIWADTGNIIEGKYFKSLS